MASMNDVKKIEKEYNRKLKMLKFAVKQECHDGGKKFVETLSEYENKLAEIGYRQKGSGKIVKLTEQYKKEMALWKVKFNDFMIRWKNGTASSEEYKEVLKCYPN